MKPSELQNFYSMLGLMPTAELDDIEAAYMRLKRKYEKLLKSPAGLAEEKQKAKVDFELITTAFRTLKDEVRRQHYDSLLETKLLSWEEDDNIPAGKKNFVNDNTLASERSARFVSGALDMLSIKSSFDCYSSPSIVKPMSSILRKKQSPIAKLINRFFHKLGF